MRIKSPGGVWQTAARDAWGDLKRWGIAVYLTIAIATLLGQHPWTKPDANGSLGDWLTYTAGPFVLIALADYGWRLLRTWIGHRQLRPTCAYGQGSGNFWLVVSPKDDLPYWVECLVTDRWGRSAHHSSANGLNISGQIIVYFPDHFDSDEMKRKPWGFHTVYWEVTPMDRKTLKTRTAFRYPFS